MSKANWPCTACGHSTFSDQTRCVHCKASVADQIKIYNLEQRMEILEKKLEHEQLIKTDKTQQTIDNIRYLKLVPKQES